MSAPLTNYTEVSLPTVDDDENIWGGINNGAHQLWDRALGAITAITTTGGTTTLSAEQAQSGYIQVSGALVSNATIAFPVGTRRNYRVRNFTSGSFTLTFRTAALGDEVTVPQFGNMMLMTASDHVQALSHPVNFNGGFRSEITHPGKAYVGPGMFFMDRIAGFARRAAGVLGITLTDAAAGDQIRLNGANTAAQPLIGIAPTGAGPWTSGFSVSETGAVRMIYTGVERARVQAGLQVGSPTGGDQGAGTLNVASGVFVNGVRTALFVESDPQPITNAISVAHALGTRPKSIGWKLRCATIEHGYAVDDDTATVFQTDADNDQGATVWASATTIGLAIARQGLRVVPKAGGGNPAGITIASWRVVFVFSA